MEQHYDNGKLNGRRTVWYKNGQKYTQDHYKDNRLHGLSTMWDPDGTVSSRMCFQNGEYADLTPENCTP
jgi:antitoxin component YwqK of YwqJK toxin-antitoxin module